MGGEYQIDAARSKNVVSVVQSEDEFGTPQTGTACVEVSVAVNNVSVTAEGPGITGAFLDPSGLFCENTTTEDFIVFTRDAAGTAEHRGFMFVVN